MKTEYDSNNSGGSWWLNDEHWLALERAGWEVVWGGSYFCHSEMGFNKKPVGKPEPCSDKNHCSGHRRFDSYSEAVAAGEDGRWLGALAKTAFRAGKSMREAADEWARVTGLDATDAGCACCGQPHTFTQYDDAGGFVETGPHAVHEARW